MNTDEKQTTEVVDDTNAAISGFLGNSPYLQFDEGGELTGIYLGCQREDDPFNPGEQRMSYLMDVDGEQKGLGSGSKRLAKAFLKVNPKVGDYVKIKRLGEGFDTQYEVEANPLPF